MALIKCGECGKEISDQANNCPNCGVKISKPTSLRNKILAVIATVLVIQCSLSKTDTVPTAPPPDPIAEARFQKTVLFAAGLKKSLREPESFDVEAAFANQDASVICIQYRARNGFGGMNVEFIVAANKRIYPDAAAWGKYCGPATFNMMHIKYALK
jgi:DNA-directed RNA polymerase subunit RPC12/RpoP